jgi:hypothetical protein
MRKYETLATQQEFEDYREAFRRNELTEEDIKTLVKKGKLRPAQYGVIVRKVYSMYKDVRRDLIKD